MEKIKILPSKIAYAKITAISGSGQSALSQIAFAYMTGKFPQYPLAIDFYAGRFCVHFFSPKRQENAEPSPKLVGEIEEILLEVFGTEPSMIYWRTRMKRKERQQYQKTASTQEAFHVHEYGLKFKVNLADYLDTGLFLDHRETRRLVAAEAAGKRLLNLFAYTCSFSVHAAAAGAIFTKSVDMSNTYTAWGRENFLLNSLPLQHHAIVRADCLKFLDDEIRSGRRYDLIVIDPPTISRSKKMEQLFDIQRDYSFLITQSLQLLFKGGAIFFSTNSRKFSFNSQLFPECTVTEISYKTVPDDFHDPKIHRCWKMQKN